MLTASALAFEFLDTFREYRPRQKAPSSSIDQAVEKLEAALAGDEEPAE